MRISIGAIIILIASILWGRQWLYSEVQRIPASLVSDRGAVVVESIDDEERLPASIRRETFQFKRVIDANWVETREKMPSSRSFAKVDYEGLFFLDWISRPNADEPRALIHFEIKSGKRRGINSLVPFVVQFKKDWVLDHLETSVARTEEEEDAINILKDFATIYAFRSGQDTAGAFEAKFTESAGETRYSKLNYRYSNDNDIVKKIVIEESRHAVKFEGETNRLISMAGEERTILRTSPDLSVSTFSRYTLTRIKQSYTRRSPVDLAQLVQAGFQLHANAWVDAPKWERVQLGLDQLVQMKKPVRMALFHDVVKNLKKDDTHLMAFKHWAERSAHNEGVLSFGVGALASAGSDEAQKVLMEWFNQYPELRHTILNSLSMSEAPLSLETQSSVLALVDQKHDTSLAYNAALTLGSDLRKSDETPGMIDPRSASRKVVEEKLTKLYEESNAAEQLIYLDAMGNSGSVAFAAVIDRSLSSNDIAVREKSAYAARFMRTAVAQSLIRKALDDRSNRVRLSAVKAIAYQRDLTLYREVLRQYAQGDDEVSKMSRQLLDAQESQPRDER